MEFYKEELNKIYLDLKSSKNGLISIEAKNRLNKFGLNEIKTKTKISKLKIFISQFKSFIIYILLFAVIISFLLKEYTDAIIILIIVFLNGVIGFFQEYNAQKSIQSLKNISKTITKVYRNDKLIKINSKCLVVGDILFLESGDKVPADCRIIESSNLKTNESSITGESLPVKKDKNLILKKVSISEQKNILFSSTTISQGTCKAIVIFTGMKTEIGKISNSINQIKEIQTPLQIKLEHFGKKLGIAIIIICIFIFSISLIKEFLLNKVSLELILNLALVSVALAVAAVPTALPSVVTIALSIGVKNLLKKNILVKKLSSVETLGSCNVICTDKTGTLTKNEMTVEYAFTLNGENNISGIGYNPNEIISGKISNILFKIGHFCNNSSLYKKNGIWKISGDPTEAALIVSAKKTNIDFENLNIKKIKELPFDSKRKLMSVLIKEENKFQILTKGSFEKLIKKCSHILIEGKEKKITEKEIEIIKKKNTDYSSNSLRVLGFAYKNIKSENEFKEEKLVFVGLQAMRDPPRKDVISSIKKAKIAGIRIIMITGDYKTTAKSIANDIGIFGDVVSGDELDLMTIKDIEKKLNSNTNIFARVSPEHKLKIISALQNNNNIVAMTGDGVNDAPALTKANIGIAVNSGCDVAKDSADLVLLKNSFSSIIDAIEEGRGIYENILKSILLLLSGNIGEVLIIFIAILLNFNLPLTAILLLWINLITDGAPAIALSVDPYNEDILKRKPKKITKNILSKSKLYLISILGIIGSIIGLTIFSIFGGNSGKLILGQTMIFNFVILFETILVFIIRKEYNIKFFSNIWLWFAIIISIIFQLIILYSPLNKIFGIIPLNQIQIGSLIISGIIFYFSYLLFYKFSKKYLFVKKY